MYLNFISKNVALFSFNIPTSFHVMCYEWVYLPGEGRWFLKLSPPPHTHTQIRNFVTQVTEVVMVGYCGTHERIKPCVGGFFVVNL